MMTNTMEIGTSAREGDAYWRAVLERDRRFDGSFVYAVRSTGVYCRPSCPSRRPGRVQAVFYGSPAAAENAGFRPCRRCQRSGEEADARRAEAECVERACREIEMRLGEGSLGGGPGSEESVTLETLSSHLGVRPRYLQRCFKRVLAVTPREYADARRFDRFKTVVKGGQNVTESLYEAGFGSSRGLYERSAAQLGMTPAAYGRGGRGMSIAFTIADSPLGRLLVAATHRGVCSVCLGESDVALEGALRAEYPQAQIAASGDGNAGRVPSQSGSEPGGLKHAVESILRHLDGSLPGLDLPLDVRATAFQRRVWRELQAIPYGSTRSYGEVARRLGSPTATRAVARACATNPVAVVIPCHRVVRTDGSLGGYRWGLGRKRALLEREAAARPAKHARSGR